MPEQPKAPNQPEVLRVAGEVEIEQELGAYAQPSCCLGGLATRKEGAEGAMKKSKAPIKVLPFDAARYLTDDARVAEYITAFLQTGDSDLLLLAFGDVARARGMAHRDLAKVITSRVTRAS